MVFLVLIVDRLMLSFDFYFRCIDKVFMEERTEFDQEITCQHSYDKRCAKSLVTVYNSQQEEECEENYVKNCFIEYSKYATNVTNKVCRTPLVKVSKVNI